MRLSIVPLLVSAGLAVAAGCTTTDPASPDTTRESSATASGGMAIIDYAFLDLDDPIVASRCAKADILITETSSLWNPTVNVGAIDRLKAMNPRLKVLGYINAHGSWLRWGDDPAYDSEKQPYGYDWYVATRPYWSYTTTGDTMMSWTNQVLLNVLDPDCRAAMIAVLASHFNRYDNRLDGFFWDHFNLWLWVPDSVPGCEGEMDLDGDGIPHREDEDEMEAYRLASEDLINGVRDALGPQVIQVANGGRALRDSVFAGLLDGMMYEHFPTLGFRGAEMREALDPTVFNNLFAARHWPRTRNGGPWLIYSNKWINSFVDDQGQTVLYRQAEFARVAALLTGGYAAYHSDDQAMHIGWPAVEVDLGAPVGPPVFAGDGITRVYDRGQVQLTFTTGTMPRPFDFTIIQDGEVAQMLAFPRHYP